MISILQEVTWMQMREMTRKDGSTVGTVSGVKEMIGGANGVWTSSMVGAASGVNVAEGTSTTTEAVDD